MLLHAALLGLAALGGSLHCLGMCGGMVACVHALCGGGRGRLQGQLLYHGGRLTSYAFLGALAGAGGAFLTRPAPFLHSLLDALAGVGMVIAGLRLAGMLPPLRGLRLAESPGPARLAATLRRGGGPQAAISLGLFNGFIPCPLIAAFLAQAAATGSALGGALTLAILVLGTAPGMLLAGRLVLSCTTRGKALRVVGVALSGLGILSLLHAVGMLPSPLGGHG
ncbi:MAG: hypothetical protein KatS3mg131_2673 [Candidatus Tectimicrobiota bacterium]|nr:MAG: hypothetical protein KatS3mg131_2673 [Candidatus Tectomicrobia bacterium]